MKSKPHQIRFEGRHLLTIGRKLVEDGIAAIIEIVKNSYDADASEVTIKFILDENDYLKIKIIDNGHGMSKDDIVNKWLIPSTSDKLKRKYSPNGRPMQGRKGVGRYAVSRVGDFLLLETSDGRQWSSLEINWTEFEQAKFTDDVILNVNYRDFLTSDNIGTTLTIDSFLSANDWLFKEKESEKNELEKLEYELKKLIPPDQGTSIMGLLDDSFEIFLEFENFYKSEELDVKYKIEAFPILELFDYKITGTIDNQGIGQLIYSNQKSTNIPDEIIDISWGATFCGSLSFDIHVYDRDSEAIEQLIQRGLKDDNGNYVGKLEARRLLNDNNGIGVYRNGFRIRPLGEADFDWLKLNQERVQNPSLRIGINQTIGYISIEPEEISGLEEKSARDGLSKNTSYTQLIKITQKVINELETKRYDYRRKAGLSKASLKIERQFEKLFEYDDIKTKIRKKLEDNGVSSSIADDVIKELSKQEEKNNIIVDEIRRTVAKYEGQATLGKIVDIVLHEGRKPLGYMTDQLPRLEKWYNKWINTNDSKYLEKIIRVTGTWSEQTSLFINLFNKLNPLASRRKNNKSEFNIIEALDTSIHVYEKYLKSRDITLVYSHSSDELKWDGWKEDLYIIFTNLLDNSIYWLLDKGHANRQIEITVHSEENCFKYLDYKDNGSGISKNDIEKKLIFEPEFTTKRLSDGSMGTGLGLAISGEAAIRNNLELKAFYVENGAYFRLEARD